MDNKKYWEKRTLEDTARAINHSEDYIDKKLKKYYKESMKDIENTLERFYETFGEKEKINLASAKKQLKKIELDTIDLAALSDKAMELDKELMKKKKEISGDIIAAMEQQQQQLEDKLSVYARKGQMNRLELLNIELEKELLKLHCKEQISIFDLLKEEYTQGYYKGIFNMQQHFGVGYSFVKLNKDAIEKAVTKSWSKSNFSKAIWGHRDKLAEDLKNNITTGIIRGESIEKMSQRISKRMEVGMSNAKRLVRTETGYIHNQASLKSYEEYGVVEKYRYLATLDRKTSKLCQDLDATLHLTKEARVGKNYPPMHPNCRSTTVAHFEDKVQGSRIARNAKGKSYEVPDNMDYKTWWNSLTEDQQGKMILEHKKEKKKNQDKEQHNRYKKIVEGKVPQSLDKFQNLKYTKPKEYEELKQLYNTEKTIHNFKEKLKVGQVNTKVRYGKQATHIQDSKAFQKRSEDDIKNGKTPPSILYKNIKVEELYQKYSGKGNYLLKSGEELPREYVTADEVIGMVYNIGTKQYEETKRFAICYARSGIHVFPIKERNDGNGMEK